MWFIFGNIYLKRDFDMIDVVWIVLIKITYTCIVNYQKGYVFNS